MAQQSLVASLCLALLVGSTFASQVPNGPFQSNSRNVVHYDYQGSVTLGGNSLPLTNKTRVVTGNQPEQISLHLINDNSIRVTYVTNVPVIGSGDTATVGLANMAAVVSVVRTSMSAGGSTTPSANLFFGSQGQYTQAYIAGDPSAYNMVGTSGGIGYGSFPEAFNYTSAVLHSVVVTGLMPSTRYFYTIGLAEIGQSTERSFKTLPAVGARKAMVIGVFGDLGDTANSSTTIGHLIQNNPDFVLNTGDYVYADTHLPPSAAGVDNPTSTPRQNLTGAYPPYTDQQRWDLYGRFLEPLASAKFQVGIAGNHEIEPDSLGRQFQSWTARHGSQHPYVESGSTNPLYYSQNNGQVHVVVLNNYIAFSPTSAQYAWFVNDMTVNLNRKNTPWVIVMFHAPVYHSVAAHYKENECFRQIYEPLFNTYGVDFVLHGHVHSYERSNPVNNYQVDQSGCAPTYITIGDGGNNEKLYNFFVDQVNPATNYTYCPGVSANGTKIAGGNNTFDPKTSVRYQAAPDGTNFVNTTNGYCNSATASPGYGVPSNESFCYTSQPPWSAYRENSFGHGIFRISANGRDARWEWHHNQDSYDTITDNQSYRRDTNACPNRAFGTPTKNGRSDGRRDGRRNLA